MFGKPHGDYIGRLQVLSAICFQRDLHFCQEQEAHKLCPSCT